MRELLRNVDIVALPSYYGAGLPRILIEAGAAGLPQVASDMPGWREAVWQGVKGFLVQPMDAEQLARAITKLLIDDELRLEMGKRSRELACNEFSEERVIDQTLRVYRECALRTRVKRSKRCVLRGKFFASHSDSVQTRTKAEERLIW